MGQNDAFRIKREPLIIILSLMQTVQKMKILKPIS